MGVILVIMIVGMIVIMAKSTIGIMIDEKIKEKKVKEKETRPSDHYTEMILTLSLVSAVEDSRSSKSKIDHYKSALGSQYVIVDKDRVNNLIEFESNRLNTLDKQVTGLYNNWRLMYIAAYTKKERRDEKSINGTD